jgi:hypothetical protein
VTWTLWILLLVAALRLLVWLGLDLYLRARRLGTELHHASEVVATLEQRTAELERTLALSTPAPVDLADPEPARLRRAEAQEARARRRLARAERHEQTYTRWRAFSR